ncbi:hypothetical protein GGI05_002615 [Coemansia sp. RSA 2603]|nr:hypothetical protein GGI05_002615 [Coemansia sp. RSA 2603]
MVSENRICTQPRSNNQKATAAFKGKAYFKVAAKGVYQYLERRPVPLRIAARHAADIGADDVNVANLLDMESSASVDYHPH